MAGQKKKMKFQSTKYLYFTVFHNYQNIPKHNFVLQIWKKDTISHGLYTEIKAKKF